MTRLGDVDEVLRVLVRAVPLLAETSDPPDGTVAAARAALRGDLTAFARSDDILDVGEPGLDFFARFAPLYSRWTGRTIDVEADVAAPYRSVAGIDLAALREDAVHYRAAAEALEAVREQLAGDLGHLAARWTGVAAEAAVGHVAGVLDAVGSVAHQVAALAGVAGDLADAVAQQVRSRAEVVLVLAGDADQCGGFSHALVQRLVDVATAPPEMAERAADALARDVRSAVGNPGPVESLVTAAVAERAAASAALLDGCFVPAFEARLAQFRDEALTGVEDDLAGLWADVAASVVDGDPFAGLPVALPGLPNGATLGTAALDGGSARLGSAEPEVGATLGVAGPEGGGATLGTVPTPPAPERVAAVTPVRGDEQLTR